MGVQHWGFCACHRHGRCAAGELSSWVSPVCKPVEASYTFRHRPLVCLAPPQPCSCSHNRLTRAAPYTQGVSLRLPATVVLLPQAIDGLVVRLDAACGSGTGVDMSDALAAMTMDVIMRTAFGWVPVAVLLAGSWEGRHTWSFVGCGVQVLPQALTKVYALLTMLHCRPLA